MSHRSRLQVSLLMIGLLTGLAIFEAARHEHLGLVGLLVANALLAVGAALSLRLRSPLMVRTDLAVWLERASAVSGESTSKLADRALSAYRASLSDDRGS